MSEKLFVGGEAKANIESSLQGANESMGAVSKAFEERKARGLFKNLENLKANLEALRQNSDPAEIKYALTKRRRIAEEGNYKYVGKFKNGVAKAKSNLGRMGEQWEFINEKGEALNDSNGTQIFKEIVEFDNSDFRAVRSSDDIHYDFLHKDLESVWGSSYRCVDFKFMSEDAVFARFAGGGDEYKVFDLLADKVSNESFDEVNPFKEGFARVVKNKRKFFINRKGEEAFPQHIFLQDMGDFNNGIARIKKQNKCYYIDTNGELLFDGKAFHTALDFKDGIARVQQDHKWYFIKEDGSELFPGKRFEKIWEFHNGFARVKDEDGWYFINEAGEDICRNQDYKNPYHNPAGIRYKKAAEKEEKKRYRRLENYEDGFAVVRDGKNWYFLDENGQQAFIDMEFSKVRSFHNGFAAVRHGNKADWFFIDKQGNRIPEHGSFASVSDFEDGVAIVTQNNKKYLLNTRGELLANGQAFEEIKPFKDGVAEAVVENKIVLPAGDLDLEGGLKVYIDVHGKRIFN